MEATNAWTVRRGHRAPRSLSHIAPASRFSTDALHSAQIPVTAMDLGGRMGHEQAPNLPSLEPGADVVAADVTPISGPVPMRAGGVI
ncbi:MAG: hypothetical protein WCK17_08365, partial [Verrucomicrobiota bacterium]